MGPDPSSDGVLSVALHAHLGLVLCGANDGSLCLWPLDEGAARRSCAERCARDGDVVEEEAHAAQLVRLEARCEARLKAHLARVRVRARARVRVRARARAGLGFHC